MKKISVLLSLVASVFLSVAFAQSNGQADAKFLDQMTEHHNDAISMAKLAEKKAQNQALKKMVQKMVKDQTNEVEQMKKWRHDLFPSAPKVESEMPKMDMTQLEKSRGHEFDKTFSEMMAKHHQQGVEIVRQISDNLTNPQVKKFAQQVAKNQTEEKEKLEKIANQ